MVPWFDEELSLEDMSADEASNDRDFFFEAVILIDQSRLYCGDQGLRHQLEPISTFLEVQQRRVIAHQLANGLRPGPMLTDALQVDRAASPRSVRHQKCDREGMLLHLQW